MKISCPKSLTDALQGGIRQVYDIQSDPDDVSDYLQGCVTELAVFVATENIECGSVDDITYWEAQTESFEAGLTVASKMQPGDRVYCVGVDSESGMVYFNQLFYFTGPNIRVVVKRLKDATKKWIVKFRQDKGLLPFPS